MKCGTKGGCVFGSHFKGQGGLEEDVVDVKEDSHNQGGKGEIFKKSEKVGLGAW